MKGEQQLPANKLSSGLARMEIVLVVLSCTALALIMCIVVLDVVMRYIFSSPLLWSYDLIGLYLIGAVFFLALPDTMHNHGHIAIDVFTPLIPMRLRHMFQSLGYAAATVLIAAIGWLGLEQSYHAYIADDRIASAIPWQTWIAHAILTIGMFVLVLRCGYRAVFHLLSAIAGNDLVEIPPPPLTGKTSGLGEK